MKYTDDLDTSRLEAVEYDMMPDDKSAVSPADPVARRPAFGEFSQHFDRVGNSVDIMIGLCSTPPTVRLVPDI